MYVRVLHHIKFHCILTRVHNLRHMLSTCCYVKTSDNLTYVMHILTKNESEKHRILCIQCICMTHEKQNMFMQYLLMMWLYFQNVSVAYVSHVLNLHFDFIVMHLLHSLIVAALFCWCSASFMHQHCTCSTWSQLTDVWCWSTRSMRSWRCWAWSIWAWALLKYDQHMLGMC